jgi:hypothetical protein
MIRVYLRSFAALLLAGVALAADPVRFNRDIRPIMSDTCFRCHGPDARARQAGLRLDQRDEALKQSKTGATPIVPGDPEKSAIVRRVFAMNATVMPPRAIHKELTAAQKETIRQWVKEGATYEGHWAWQPVQRPVVPEIAGAASPIDAFIRERLAREGLKPSPDADKRTLLRRASLDLTGVPPTPEEFAAFVADKSNDAYDRAVDRLLQKPGYAETQARYWLDAVRYADSAGFHGDNLWPAWPYRDYVLRAFRDCGLNTPDDIALATFDEMTVDDLFKPAITTVVQPAYDIGFRAAELLLKRIEQDEDGEEPVTVRLPATLKVCDSSGLPVRKELRRMRAKN